MRADHSEADLVQRCLEGDAAAWDTLVRAYWKRVFHIAYKFVAQFDEAEDLTQEIFVKLFRALPTYDRRASFECLGAEPASRFFVQLRRLDPRGIKPVCPPAIAGIDDMQAQQIFGGPDASDGFGQLRAQHGREITAQKQMSRKACGHPAARPDTDIDFLAGKVSQGRGTINANREVWMAQLKGAEILHEPVRGKRRHHAAAAGGRQAVAARVESGSHRRPRDHSPAAFEAFEEALRGESRHRAAVCPLPPAVSVL